MLTSSCDSISGLSLCICSWPSTSDTNMVPEQAAVATVSGFVEARQRDNTPYLACLVSDRAGIWKLSEVFGDHGLLSAFQHGGCYGAETAGLPSQGRT